MRNIFALTLACCLLASCAIPAGYYTNVPLLGDAEYIDEYAEDENPPPEEFLIVEEYPLIESTELK